ncbi:FxsA family protein [Fluviibacterium sp. DFM31]|uniref:FxsA family protein n=1 Tax=Meridianimarinicoccus marinus TaxID=3231483 RepID=A0ABV3LAX4_9RHOB
MWLLFAFIAIPLIEIGLFIQVGGWLGLWPTLAIVVGTAIAGTALVRSQGLAALGQIQRSFEEMADPTGPLAHGAMILLSGVLLLTPGFFTDAVGFALLVPAVRERVFTYLRSRVKVTSFSTGPAQNSGPMSRGRPGDGVIDGEFYEVDPDEIEPRPGTRPSKWTQD